MTAMTFQLLGGIGLFLLGMVLLTDGLKAYAGQALQEAMARFTGTPTKAFASGALVTLMVQSSSATTVTLIGFVSAGLIAFPQAVGVVFGASLGTTGTGWIVAVLGLKVNLGFYALPLVGIGALLRLLGHGRVRAAGLALAGFGLIFIGIETLQNGMQGLAGRFDLAALPAAGLRAHLIAAGIGLALTVVMQSSSAAAATTLTALHTQAINFEQAAAMVIGAAIGTTVTGALAAIGGSVPAKRTALTHILFNLTTGAIAIGLMPLLLWGLSLAQRHDLLEPGAVSLAAFHTTFIALGVALFLPFAARFAAWIERLLPEKGPHLTRHLDSSLLNAPAVALEASRRTLVDIAQEMLDLLGPLLREPDYRPDTLRRREIALALSKTQAFFARIPPLVEDEPLSCERVAQVHAIDHLTRLLARGKLGDETHAAVLQPSLAAAREQCLHVLNLAQQALRGDAELDWQNEMETLAIALAVLRDEERLKIMRQTALGLHSPAEGLNALDAVRWLERVTNHCWRACLHLAEPKPAQTAPASAVESPTPLEE